MRSAVFVAGLAALALSAGPLAAQRPASSVARALTESRPARTGAAERALSSSPLIRPNQFLQGELGAGDIQLQNGWVLDKWSYQGAKNELVSFTAKAGYQMVVAVFLEQGTQPMHLAESDSATGEVTVELKLPQDGSYLIYVVGTKPTSRGAYTLATKSQGSVTKVDWARLYPGGGHPDGRYALLVAADDYPGEDSDLAGGPTNDVLLMQTLLTQKYGFKPSDIVILRDVEANRDQIIEAFRRHLGQAGPNGVAVFHYSGHGMQLPDNRGWTGADDPEPDGKDEAVATWGTQGDLYGYLLDDELAVLTNELKAGRALVILDMCHAGTGTRGGPIPRDQLASWSQLAGSVRAPEGFGVVHAQAGAVTAQPRFIWYRDFEAEIENPAKLITTNATPAGNEYTQPANHILIAASSPTETSANYALKLENGNTARVGLLTFMVFKTLMDGPATLTFNDVITQIGPETNRVAMEFKKSSQTPAVEGARAGETVASFLAQRQAIGRLGDWAIGRLGDWVSRRVGVEAKPHRRAAAARDR